MAQCLEGPSNDRFQGISSALLVLSTGLAACASSQQLAPSVRPGASSTELLATMMPDYCIGSTVGIAEFEAPLVFKSNPGDVNGDYYYMWMEKLVPTKTYAALRTRDWRTQTGKQSP